MKLQFIYLFKIYIVHEVHQANSKSNNKTIVGERKTL